MGTKYSFSNNLGIFPNRLTEPHKQEGGTLLIRTAMPIRTRALLQVITVCVVLSRVSLA